METCSQVETNETNAGGWAETNETNAGGRAETNETNAGGRAETNATNALPGEALLDSRARNSSLTRLG